MSMGYDSRMAPQPGGDAGLTVLLAEDEMLIAEDLRFELVRSGHHVVGPFPTTADALAAIQNEAPDVAVLDVRLLDGDVFPLAEQLRSRGTRIIFHSGHAKPAELIARFPEARVIVKPASGDAVIGAIRHLSCAGGAGDAGPAHS